MRCNDSQFHGIQYKISSTIVWNMIHEVQHKYLKTSNSLPFPKSS
jgi:hypothetical protein